MGGGPEYARIVAYADSVGVADAFTFTGRADNDTICRVLSTADIAVDPCPFSPHADISTATKIMEYMFFSLPIVAFDLTETKRSGGDAIHYARIGEEADFAEKIIELLGNEGMRKDLGRRGRQRLDEVLSWKRSAEALVNLMEDVIAPSRQVPTHADAAVGKSIVSSRSGSQ
jgi:glycosyltransferase involved in cell wall biosynthesis